jgi:hypothetical protein
MSYESVDKLQNILAQTVFFHTKDAKKAAGRALGTLVEIITFYLLKTWGFEHSIAIERALAEYGNPEIKHNVEYSLHPVLQKAEIAIPFRLPITAARIRTAVDADLLATIGSSKTATTLLRTDLTLRNSCLIAHNQHSHIVATLTRISQDRAHLYVIEQSAKPYAMFECKRVGVEEGMRKGPQTIEKAKQGAYVAKSVSSLHKIRLPSGELQGLMFRANQAIYVKPYQELIAEVIGSNDPELLRDFILTVGVVSNHGNWFTSNNHNKELKVLAQSYDWLIFLTDTGLSEFISQLLLEPQPTLEPARNAFLASYTADKKRNRFTKVQMDYEADQALQNYFQDNGERIESWFNVITPQTGKMSDLHGRISQLRDKNWREVHLL